MRRFILLLLSVSMVPIAYGFTDTNTSEWSASIGYLKDHHIVQGYADGSYKPSAKINRAEFTKIVIEALFEKDAYAPYTESCFPDVPAHAWMTPYICFAKAEGIIGGHPDGTFHPGDNVNQAEALKILLLAFDEPLVNSGGEWYQTYLMTAKSLGMLYFAGGNEAAYKISRGEMAYFTAWLLAKHEEETPVDQLTTIPAYIAPFTYTVEGDTHVIVMSAKDVTMHIVSGNNSLRAKECDFPHHCVAEAQAESFESYSNRLDGRLLINGPFFEAYSAALNGRNYHQIASDIIINGEMQSMYGWDAAFGNGGMLAEMHHGGFTLFYPVREWLPMQKDVRNGVSNYPLVLLNGTPRSLEEIGIQAENDAKFAVSSRRGGLGISADGSTIIYVNTVGTVTQLGETLLHHGASTGFALDAGASNGLEFDGRTLFTPGRNLATVIEFSERH